MSKNYASPVFGATIPVVLDRTGAVNGTVGATELSRYQMFKNGTVTGFSLRVAVGGTEAGVRKILLGYSLAGTGTVSQIGTITLGTLANNTFKTGTCTVTSFGPSDQIVISHLGTGAGVYDLEPVIEWCETFANA